MDNKKILFTDLDGTFLCTDKSLCEANRLAVRQALSGGHHIVYTTGRATLSVVNLLKRVDLYLPGSYLICFNGALIYDIAGQTVLSRTSISRDLVVPCFALAEEMGIHLQTYTGEGASTVIALHDDPYLETYGQIQALPYQVVPDIGAALDFDPPKMLAVEPDPEKMARFREAISQIAGNRLDMFMSSPLYLELVSPGTSKGNAVHFLCNHLGIPVANSIAAGDAENDLSMLDAAGIGVAMLNGTSAAKSHADHVTTLDNDHGGVAEIIEKYMLR